MTTGIQVNLTTGWGLTNFSMTKPMHFLGHKTVQSGMFWLSSLSHRYRAFVAAIDLAELDNPKLREVSEHNSRFDHIWICRQMNGAGDEIRTHDIYLGKVTLYP